MLAAFTKLINAQKVKQFLVKRNLINTEFLAVKELNHIYFPIIKKIKVPKAKIVNTKIKFPARNKTKSVAELLKSKLTKKQIHLIPKSQEVVGKILILEIPEELSKKEKLIAAAYLESNKNIDTVVKKHKTHSGIFRTRSVKILAGKMKKETIHLENGVKVKLHLEKTYFSARLASERLRIAKLIKKPEQILVMFSGAAPYPLVIAKNSPVKSIYGIEINPLAHQYALENVQLNKFTDRIKIFNGDVRKILPKVNKKFDRIVMPLPKTGEDFLDLALKKVKPNGVIHLYSFLDEKEVKSYIKKIKEISARTKKKIRILRKVKCGQFSPSVYRICFDIKKIR